MSNITQNGGIIYIQQSGNNIQYQSNSTSGAWTNISGWPVTFINSNPVSGNLLTVSLTTNITISNTTIGTGTNGYFITGSSYITYDGTGKTVTIDTVTNYLGLIRNGTSGPNGYSNITVQNFGVLSSASTISTNSGWICQFKYSKGSINNLVQNCYSTGLISDNSGGICGTNAGENGSCIVNNCYSTGTISGSNAGGICGSYSGNNNGILLISNCYNTGDINGEGEGGICGPFGGNNNGLLLISNCYNTGAISGNYSGGICGGAAGYTNGTVTINNCYNNGIISGNYCGGITGDWFGYNSNNLCTIQNCYSLGNITGNNSGGITGAEVGYNDNAIYTPKILIQNCYSLGNIGTTSGGICGGTEGYVYTNIPIVNITNCYTAYNTIVDSGSEYIATNLQTAVRNAIILTNVYSSLISSWSDSSANSSLTGVPSSLYSNNPGATWFSVANNTPYLLSSFNASLYSPSTVNNTSLGDYVSSAGLFTPSYSYNLISVNDALPSTDITINNTTGVLTFANLLTNTYIEKVFCYKGTSPSYYGYNFNTFTLNQTIPVPGITITQNGGIIYIQQSGSAIQYQSNSTSGIWTTVTGWPITFVNSNPVASNILTISLFTNITISNTTIGTGGIYGHFITGSSYITYDGTRKTVTIDNVTNYLGLIQNGTSGGSGFSNITVQNILLTTINSILAFRGGWICQSFFGNSSFNTLISNCHVDSPIGPNNQCGGLCGCAFAQGNGTLNSSSALIIGCSKAGLNNSANGAAITSLRTGQLGGNVKISNCYNTGAISNDCSGICGQQAGQDSGKVEIIMCYNTGAISSNASSGICGYFAGTVNGTLSILNCYNTGIISGNSSSGICGQQAGYNNGTVTITNCYNNGIISGQYAGGICGPRAGDTNGIVTINNCYNTGNINGANSGGIIGDWFGVNSNNLCSIINCYNTGNITGSNAGGITGAEVGYNDSSYTPKILIQNCYSLGNISTTSGGICGGTEGNVYTNIPVVNITNCYTAYNSIIDSGSEYIATNLQIAVRNYINLTNVYSSLINSWSDTNANNSLSGSQSIFKNSILYKYYSNFGAFWYSNKNNTPFNLTSYLNTVPRKKRIDNVL